MKKSKSKRSALAWIKFMQEWEEERQLYKNYRCCLSTPGANAWWDSCHGAPATLAGAQPTWPNWRRRQFGHGAAAKLAACYEKPWRYWRRQFGVNTAKAKIASDPYADAVWAVSSFASRRKRFELRGFLAEPTRPDGLCCCQAPPG